MSTLRLTHIPSEINARVSVPLSKSICNRSLILSKVLGRDLAKVPLSSANDSQLLFSILSEFPNEEQIDVKDAGTVSRFMTALCSAQKGQTFVLKGTERMHERPIGHLVDALVQLGAEIEYLDKDGYLPLKVKGKALKGSSIDLSDAPSSQFASALLLISPLISGELILRIGVKQVSKPYVDMTSELLSKLGANVSKGYEEIRITESKLLKAIDFPDVHEPDWSAAIYPLLINTLQNSTSIIVNNLKLASKQGDSRINGFFEPLGFRLTEIEDGVQLTGRLHKPEFIEFDMIDTPDLAQPLACYCVSQKIPFRFTGLETLQKKETKRIDALDYEFQKFGVISMKTSASIEVNHYPDKFNSNVVFESYDDHRMAMSLFFLMMAEPSSLLNGHESVKKSFPAYWDVLREMGFRFDFR